MEEPIYMPNNARPISPVASYQPGQFPYEAYLNQQQYATIDKGNRYRKHNKRQGSATPSGGGGGGGGGANGDKKSKGGGGGGKAHQSSDSNAEDSEFGAAGIYKKGHINKEAKDQER